MLEFIVPALQNLLTIENLIWINLGVFIGSVFAAIPGLTVMRASSCSCRLLTR